MKQTKKEQTKKTVIRVICWIGAVLMIATLLGLIIGGIINASNDNNVTTAIVSQLF